VELQHCREQLAAAEEHIASLGTGQGPAATAAISLAEARNQKVLTLERTKSAQLEAQQAQLYASLQAAFEEAEALKEALEAERLLCADLQRAALQPAPLLRPPTGASQRTLTPQQRHTSQRPPGATVLSPSVRADSRRLVSR